MQLPAATSHYSALIRAGRYTLRRCRRAKLDTLAADLEKATLVVRDTGRAVEDADGPVQDALADRTAADDDLDDVAKAARAKLAGRSVDAVRKAPYTAIYPNGIGYYTAAPLDEEEQRYTELRQRLTAHLDDTDEVRVQSVPAIDAGLALYKAGAADLIKARNAQALAKTAHATAREAWETLMEKTWGHLVTLLGKEKAERFFARVRRTAAPTADDGGTDTQ
ncbi:hypothetical protein A7982_13921 [Minicystis rosea]|nr:hypothetical protein A7982_13921 [Minicystis rosea]